MLCCYSAAIIASVLHIILFPECNIHSETMGMGPKLCMTSKYKTQQPDTPIKTRLRGGHNIFDSRRKICRLMIQHDSRSN